MTIRIYNSLTKSKQDISPPEKQKTIKMYCCGVTVYDRSHIGHARSLYLFDMIKRYFVYRGYDIHFVRNITDIDDKIINKAKEMNQDWQTIVKENIDAYQKDLKSLGVGEGLGKDKQEPRATQNIKDIIKNIEALIEKDFAYEVSGDVYYQVRKFKDYGKLSGQSIEKMQDAVRIEMDPNKKDPLDFALWKKSKEGEPSWSSPWGDGRPGWHIECSCMSLKHLDCETLDIHAGGRDLIFPHHENEIAQAEAITGKPFAKIWMHHGLLTINGQKMAKSLGNFITIEEALKKISADELKFFFLSSHYASPMDYSDMKMDDIKKAFERIKILTDKLNRLNLAGQSTQSDKVSRYRESFIEAMDDDFNTPKALSVVFDMVTWCNKQLDNKKDNKAMDGVIALISEIADIFGLNFGNEMQKVDQDIETLLSNRLLAREKKDFKQSDQLRDQLMDKGIIVEDTKDGQIWRKA